MSLDASLNDEEITRLEATSKSTVEAQEAKYMRCAVVYDLPLRLLRAVQVSAVHCSLVLSGSMLCPYWTTMPPFDDLHC